MSAIRTARMNASSLARSNWGLIGVSEYLASQNAVENIRLALHLIALPLNSINVYVYTRRGTRMPTSPYHVAMGLLQIVYILAALVSPLGRLVNMWTSSCYFCTLYSTIIGHCILLTSTRAMYGVICLVSFERLLAIAFPLQTKQFRFTKHPVMSIVFLISLVFLSHTYIAIRYEIYSESSEEVKSDSLLSVSCGSSTDALKGIASQDNLTTTSQTPLWSFPGTSSKTDLLLATELPNFPTSHVLHLTQTSHSVVSSPCPTSDDLTVAPNVVWKSRFSSVYQANPNFFATWTVVAGVVWVYAVLVLELLISVLIVIILLRHSHRRKDITTSDSDKRERQVRQTTKTVLLSSLVFLFLNLLQVTNSIASSLAPDYNSSARLRYTYLFVHNLGQLSFSLSLCSDLLTFFLLSSTHRTAFRKLIGGVCVVHSKMNVNKRLTGLSGTYIQSQVFSTVTQERLSV